MNFQKLLESQLDFLLTSSPQQKTALEIASLEGLKDIKSLKVQQIPTMNATHLAAKTQKTIQNQAVKNLVKNKGGAWNEKVSVKSILGNLSQGAVSISRSILIKIQTHKREIIMLGGICIAIYAIISVLNIKLPSPKLSVPQIAGNLSNAELMVLSEEILGILSAGLEEYLELTGGKVKGSNPGATRRKWMMSKFRRVCYKKLFLQFFSLIFPTPFCL